MQSGGILNESIQPNPSQLIAFANASKSLNRYPSLAMIFQPDYLIPSDDHHRRLADTRLAKRSFRSASKTSDTAHQYIQLMIHGGHLW